PGRGARRRARTGAGGRARAARLRFRERLAQALALLAQRARLRHGPAADRALGGHVALRGAVLAAEVDHLQVERRPALAREQLLQIVLDLLDGAGARELPAPGE